MNLISTDRLCKAVIAFSVAGFLILFVPEGSYANDAENDRERRWRLNGAVDGARLLRRGAPFWQLASRSGTIPAGSDLEIPEGGGLARPDVGGLSVQRLARFQVPSTGSGKSLQHIQGQARYDIQQRFDVATPQLHLSTADALFDLKVDVYGTQIDVVQGYIKVATNDGVSEQRIKAGESARVSSTNLAKLELRRSGHGRFATTEFGLGRSASSNDEGRSGGSRLNRESVANGAAANANNGRGAGSNQSSASSNSNNNKNQGNRGGNSVGRSGSNGKGGNSGKGNSNGKGKK